MLDEHLWRVQIYVARQRCEFWKLQLVRKIYLLLCNYVSALSSTGVEMLLKPILWKRICFPIAVDRPAEKTAIYS